MSSQGLLRRTAKDSMVYLPSMVVPAILGIVLIRVFTTVFSAREYGHYHIMLSTFAFIKVFSVAWLANSSVRFFIPAKNSNRLPEFFSTLFFNSLITSVLVTGLALVVAEVCFRPRLDPDLFSLIRVGILGIGFISWFEIFIVLYRAGFEPKKYVLFWLFYVVGKPLVGLGLIFSLNIGVLGLIWGFVLVSLVLDFLLFHQFKLARFVRLRYYSWDFTRAALKFGLPIALSTLSFWLLSFSDRYLIEFFRDSTQVGLYSVGYSLSEKTLQFSFMVLMLAAYPILVDVWESEGDRSAQNLITDLTRYYFYLFTPILVVLLTLPRHVLIFFSDEKYIAGARVLPLIAAGIYLFGLSQYVLKGFELHKKSGMITIVAVIAGMCNVAMNLILIPRYGYLGAGISSCISFVVYLVISVFLSRWSIAWIVPGRSLLVTGVAGIAMSGFLLLSHPMIDNVFLKLLVFVPLSLVVFYGILFLFSELESQIVGRGWLFLRRYSSRK